VNQYNILLKEEAKADIKDAYDYYENQSENLGYYFITDLENTLKDIQKAPRGYTSKYNPFRKIPLSIFPFIIMYELEGDDIVVYLVFNTSQDPKKLAKKLKKK